MLVFLGGVHEVSLPHFASVYMLSSTQWLRFWGDKKSHFMVWLHWKVFMCGVQPSPSAILTLAKGPSYKAFCRSLSARAPPSYLMTWQRREWLWRAVHRCWELMNHFCNTTCSSSLRIVLQHGIPEQTWFPLCFCSVTGLQLLVFCLLFKSFAVASLFHMMQSKKSQFTETL